MNKLIQKNNFLSELLYTYLPLFLIFHLLSSYVLVENFPINAVIGVVIPSTFAIYAFYLPKALNDIRTLGKNLDNLSTDGLLEPEDAEELLSEHLSKSRILLRSVFMTLSLFLYPAVTYLKNQQTSGSDGFIYNNLSRIDTLFMSISFLLILNIFYLIYLLSSEYFINTRSLIHTEYKYEVGLLNSIHGFILFSVLTFSIFLLIFSDNALIISTALILAVGSIVLISYFWG